MSTRPGRATVIRDTLSWVFAWTIMASQAGIGFDPPSQPNDLLVLVAAALIGVPGAVQILSAVYGRITSTGGSSPQPPLPESSASSSGGP